jgi:transcriptional regulator with XRE-family HTH domain
MEGFGARVALARGKVGWTRRELAKRASLHEQHLAKVERGQRPRLEADTVVKLAKALGCTSDYLLGLAEDPTPQAPAALHGRAGGLGGDACSAPICAHAGITT